MTFGEICLAHPEQRRVAHVAAGGGVTLSFGLTLVDWPSDWPKSGIDRQFFESRGFEILREEG
ncbi:MULTISPECIES: hypothetical protein [Burkholderia]|uniref:Uncharacterized protein n=2 Tax=Burkholderia cepacia complex TaxID=87882 RepID=A0AAP1YDU7_9BURK|nr:MULTISPECIES: hypothetical protein [Burkholderia]MBK1902192.1 hypothetical protein [Burkholderia contaminans]MBK1910475.1 hypothetical protein [Burkholderia contaminans]MBK1923934.1 hypothetical protein [Burkholderia contaminans]MBK1932146.1 hypothetical protein [Burkholderia contaminans]MBK1939395.1 hypothetical protein [Burkholderia contaminans]